MSSRHIRLLRHCRRWWHEQTAAGVHGFAILQRDGLFTYAGDPEESLGHMVQAFVHQIEAEVSG